MRNLSLKQLQAVAAVARLGTMTRAAQELNVTSAALYARIRQLEEEAGLLLFDRTPTGLKPTDAGREMLWAINSINTVLETCTDRLRTLKGGGGGRVALGVVSTAKYFAPAVIAGFMESHPKVEIALTVGNRQGTIDALRNYDIDFAIMGRPPRDFAIEAETFGPHPLVVIAAPDHPLAGRRGLSRADLAEESFLVREEGSGTRSVFEEFMNGVMIRRAKLGIDAGSNETLKQAVMAGLGIALLSGHTVASEVESGRLALLDVQGLPIRRDWYVVRRSDKVLGPAADAFWDYLSREGRRFLPRLPDEALAGMAAEMAPRLASERNGADLAAEAGE
ncbi:LysR family transcriptional regulator [Methylobacterium sp. Leaf456]|uniref:LysR family transcriptional regulator n=1 Tax=Methylobacterium sp. Leaf456 TaxID=1736382 RepID=UPI0006FB57B0|nr:LysR family transcriptional regulator [Methylobacterium sp. Leaf456]KQT46687.1 LysR family transcriptional regulator [Methylobacterium sp. Leaf456]